MDLKKTKPVKTYLFICSLLVNVIFFFGLMVGVILYAVNLAAMTNEISAVIEENSLLQNANQELRAEVETLTEDEATARAKLDKAIAEIAKMKSELQN